VLSCYAISITDFCLIIWSAEKASDLEKFQQKINRFLLCFFHPNYSKKQDKRSGNKTKKVSIPELLEKLDLLTISERRTLMLIKFVLKMHGSTMFADWFKLRDRREGTIFNRLIICSFKSQIFKKSVKWTTTNTWNEYVLVCSRDEETSVALFLDNIRDKIISNRKNCYM